MTKSNYNVIWGKLDYKVFCMLDISCFSADILYEDLERASEKIEELRSIGVKVAVFEVGDQFCPVFRLAEIEFDYAFMDTYSTNSLDDESADRVARSLVKYLHHLDAKVIAPLLDSEAKIIGAKAVLADGYTGTAKEDICEEVLNGGY